MNGRSILAVALLAVLPIVSGSPLPAAATEAKESLAEEVRETERAFARTMADRDHEAFTRFLSEEAVFVSAATARGRAAVAAQWEPYFQGPEAPFSWEPETVEVLESGDLALSSGPVYDAEGRRVSTFTSIWRRDEPGVWRILFDKGEKACD